MLVLADLLIRLGAVDSSYSTESCVCRRSDCQGRDRVLILVKLNIGDFSELASSGGVYE
jgi:hypothetical protein